MHLKKFLLFGLIAAILPAFAEEAADRKTATSLKYVEHELDTRQNKFTAEQNKAMEYTNTAGAVEKRAVKSDLGSSTSDTSLPMVGGVNTKLATKQDDIAAINDHTAVTYTGTAGKIGAKGIYQTSESYVEQSNNLIDAKTFNAALKRGLDSEFLCSEYKPGTDLCWVWAIHNNGPKNLYDPATNPIEQGNINSSNGQPIDNLGAKRVRTGFINVEPNTQYTISSGGLSYIFVYQYRSDETYLSGNSIAWHASPSTFTTSQSTGKIRILLANGQNPDTSTSITPSDLLWLQVEAGSTATPYQDVPYTTLVPAGYTPVEWIESTGTQYIDTGIVPTLTTGAYVRASFTTLRASTDNIIFGASNVNGFVGGKAFSYDPFRSFSYFAFGNFAATNNYKVNAPTTVNTVYEYELNYMNSGKAKTDTTETIIPTATEMTNKSIFLFGCSYAGRLGGDSTIGARVYNFKISNGTNIIQNLIPARRNNDNKLGMYDRINGVFYTNAATSGNDFTAGPDINNIIYVPQGQN